jgi:hypothetical protein
LRHYFQRTIFPAILGYRLEDVALALDDGAWGERHGGGARV